MRQAFLFSILLSSYLSFCQDRLEDRMNWLKEERGGTLDTLPDYELALKQLQSYYEGHKAEFVSFFNRSGNWKPIGPYQSPGGIYGLGKVNCAAFHPTDINTFWVGTAAGGIWKTEDMGSTWTALERNLPVLGINAIAVDPSDPKTLFVATGEHDADPQARSTLNAGVYKSTNGGLDWVKIGSPEMKSINAQDIIIREDYPDVVLVASAQGIFKSNDGGTNWYQVASQSFSQIVFSPAGADTLFAASTDYWGYSQVFKSGNEGESWEVMTSFSNVSRIRIGVTEADHGVVDAFCASAEYPGTAGLFRSYTWGNPGSFFRLLGNREVNGESLNLLGYDAEGRDYAGQGSYAMAYVISPQNPQKVFVGGVNTWTTSDVENETMWRLNAYWDDRSAPANVQLVHADVHEIYYHPLNSQLMIQCNDGGIYISRDEGRTWEDKSNNLQISQVYRIGSSATDPDLLIVGLQDNGSKVRRNGVWEDVLTADGMECLIDFQDPKYMYGSIYNGEFYRSNDSFTQLDQLDTISHGISYDEPPAGAWITPLVMDPNDPKVLYAGYDEVFKSPDRGDTWTRHSNNLYRGERLKRIAVSKSAPNVIYVSNGWELFRTEDPDGYDWTTIAIPVDTLPISDVLVHPRDSKIVWITRSGYGDGAKVFQSLDEGKTWQNISGTLTNLPVHCIAYDEETTSGLYIGTDLGVYYRDDAIGDWIFFSTGLPNVMVTDLEIQYGIKKLRSATYGRGIWESDLFRSQPIAAPVSLNKQLRGPKKEEVVVYDYLYQPVLQSMRKNLKDSIGGLEQGIYFLGSPSDDFQELKSIIKEE